MSGHSKWSTIRHKKAATDARKGKVFSKLVREIMMAARAGGGDLETNMTLRSAVQKARAANMPADNIDRAVKKGTGDWDGAALEEVAYEGYAAGGVAVLVMAVTDNRNRTASEVRHTFVKHQASLGSQGSVSRLFRRQGQVIVACPREVQEDQLLEWVLEAGALDLTREEDRFQVITDPSALETVAAALDRKDLNIEQSEIVMAPETLMPVTNREQAASLLRFMEALEDLDDVQQVYANFDMDDDLLASLGE